MQQYQGTTRSPASRGRWMTCRPCPQSGTSQKVDFRDRRCQLTCVSYSCAAKASRSFTRPASCKVPSPSAWLGCPSLLVPLRILAIHDNLVLPFSGRVRKESKCPRYDLNLVVGTTRLPAHKVPRPSH